MSLFALSHMMPVQSAGVPHAAVSYAREQTAGPEGGSVPFEATLAALVRNERPLSLTESLAKKAEAAAVGHVADEAADRQVAGVREVSVPAHLREQNHVPGEPSSFGFWDFVDLINPLQHLPVVGTLYREITGDTIKPEVRVAGSILLGVATGSILLSAASGIASAIMEQENGEEPAIMLANALWGADSESGETLHLRDDETIQMADAAFMLPLTDIAPSPVPAPIHPVVAAAVPDNRLAQAVKAEITEDDEDEQEAKQASMDSDNKAAQNMLAALIEEQAKARERGQPVPPQLVHDFMLTAMDHYAVAARMAPAQ